MTAAPHTVSAREMMRGLSVQHLRFVVRPLQTIHFDSQPGSSLRGGLYQALAQHFCSEPFGVVTEDHLHRCPVCWLLAFEDPANQRGRDIARPLTIEPPTKQVYERGEKMAFGVSLVGDARNLLPYLARAVEWLGQLGVGRGRSRFELLSINEYSPLLDAERILMDGHDVRSPTLAITPERIAERADLMHTERVSLFFVTPTRLIADGKLIRQPEPPVVIARLLERCQALAAHFAEQEDKPTTDVWKQLALTLVKQAQSLRLAYVDVRWVEAFSGSKRQGYATPISGFIGPARWEGELIPFHEWLLWGESLHIGKNAVKGNGWYHVDRPA